MPSLKKIKEDLKALKQYDVVLFGSIASKQATPRSDIDIAVLSKTSDREKNKDLWYNLLEKVPTSYDFKVFELLPLPIQINIANNNKVIFGDPLEISEYFYYFRKLWKDTEKRYIDNQFSNFREKQKTLQEAKNLVY